MVNQLISYKYLFAVALTVVCLSSQLSYTMDLPDVSTIRLSMKLMKGAVKGISASSPSYLNFYQFPSQFVACLFCRTPQPKDELEQLSNCRRGCECKIMRMLCELLAVENGKSSRKHAESLIIGVCHYFEKSEQQISRKYIKDFGDWRIYEKTFEDKLQPGIYQGAAQLENGDIAHAWSDNLVIDPIDKKLVLNRDDAEAHVKYICEKYGVFGPETGQITLQTLPSSERYKIFIEKAKS